MDFIAEIRRRHFISGESISSIALSLKRSRTTVRKHLKTIEEPIYQRNTQSFPKLGGQVRKIKVGHFRLCYSRKMFVVAYPCETQEMVLDAHNLAFLYVGGVPLRLIPATAPALPLYYQFHVVQAMFKR